MLPPLPTAALALALTEGSARLDLTQHWAGYAALAVFAVAYLTVMAEERLHLRKSKPVILAAGIIWAFIGLAYAQAGDTTTAAAAVRHSIAEYGELFLFILVAMTFVNTMEERQVFDALRAWLLRRRLSVRSIFWVTGVLAFFLSSQLDNLTTALVMGTVVITVGREHPRFVALACVNVVVAANAGGAWSPFGDITTLMVWQAGRAGFFDFYRLFLPSLVNWLVPALFMSLAIERGRPAAADETAAIRRGGLVVVGLFGATIATAVVFYNVLKLPPVVGMTTGLGVLKLYGYYLHRTAPRAPAPAPVLPSPEPVLAGVAAGEAWRGAPQAGAAAPVPPAPAPLHAAAPAPAEGATDDEPLGGIDRPARDSFDIFDILRGAEWDTLMFFYGIILCVGGLATAGYLSGLSEALYGDFGPTVANVAVGLLSAVVDNIPVMFAVLSMDPQMELSQWLLVTLTAGVGGSLLSIGSAAGVALMGQARGAYTFGSHLRWTWAIALGYAASIWVHLLVNGS